MKYFKEVLIYTIIGLFVGLGGSTGHSQTVKIFDTLGVPRGISIDTSGRIGGSNGLSIAKGDVTGVSVVHKFGEAPDFDIDADFVHIWDGADDNGINQNIYIFSTTASIDSISSSEDTDTGNAEIHGLDINWELVVQTVAITGETKKALTIPLIRIFRIKNTGSSDWDGEVYVYEDTAITNGVPINTTKIKAMVHAGNNQTLMAIYSVPAGKTAYLQTFFAALSKKAVASVIIQLKTRSFGGVFQIKHITSINTDATSHFQHCYPQPQKFLEKTDIVILASTGVNAVGVSAGFDIILIDN